MSITLGVSSVMSKSYRQMIDRRTTNGGVCAAHLRWICGVRPALDGRLLAYFVAVAEELHFGHAAARVHIEQPSLSVQIRKLEHTLNTPLLVRTSRRVELTPAGEVLLDGSKRLLTEAERIASLAQDAGRRPPPPACLAQGSGINGGSDLGIG